MNTPTALPRPPGQTIVWIREADLAKELGISREVLLEVRARALVEGADWERQKNAVVYSDAAIPKVRAALDAGAPEKKDGGAELSVVDPRAPVTVYVRRPARFNPRLLFASEKKDGGAELSVRVRDVRLFVQGQEIAIVPMEGVEGVYRLAGRQPRGRGKTHRRPQGRRA